MLANSRPNLGQVFTMSDKTSHLTVCSNVTVKFDTFCKMLVNVELLLAFFQKNYYTYSLVAAEPTCAAVERSKRRGFGAASASSAFESRSSVTQRRSFAAARWDSSALRLPRGS